MDSGSSGGEGEVRRGSIGPDTVPVRLATGTIRRVRVIAAARGQRLSGLVDEILRSWLDGHAAELWSQVGSVVDGAAKAPETAHVAPVTPEPTGKASGTGVAPGAAGSLEHEVENGHGSNGSRKRHAPLSDSVRRQLPEEAGRLRGQGLSIPQIAERLGVSPRTVSRLFSEGSSGGDQPVEGGTGS